MSEEQNQLHPELRDDTNSSGKNDTAAGPATVLIIDDEVRILAVCREILQVAGHNVLIAEDGREGLKIFAAQHEAIDVVIIDWILPGISGDQWLEQILEIDPEARVIFCTGQFLGQAILRQVESKVVGFLKKPFGADQLLGAVQKARGGAATDHAGGEGA